MKVVFHINENDKWSSVLKDIQQLLAVEKSNVISIELVASGEAVNGYTDAHLGIMMHELVVKGIRLTAGQNDLVTLGIKETDIHPFVKLARDSNLRLIECQTADYAYIKA